MHSPPHSKYLKHPVRRMARYLSVCPAGKTQESESCGIAAYSRCEMGYAVLTLRTKEVVQSNAQDIDRSREGLACPVPPMENLRECIPVGEVGLGGDHWSQEHDVCEGDGHSAASEWVTHVPRITEKDNAFLGVWSTLLDRWQERVGHTPETVF